MVQDEDEKLMQACNGVDEPDCAEVDDTKTAAVTTHTNTNNAAVRNFIPGLLWRKKRDRSSPMRAEP
jgi:hypothetical protein